MYLGLQNLLDVLFIYLVITNIIIRQIEMLIPVEST